MKKIIEKEKASSCYFRSSVRPPNRKALLQITEQCNLSCLHCFVNAQQQGNKMTIDDIKRIIPKLKKCKVVSVSLTGGEPFMHPKIMKIVSLLIENNFRVGICTNATLISLNQIKEMSNLGNIHLNVSLDGFREKSHSKFRGRKGCFSKTISSLRELGKHHLLQGILVTPNNLADINEYVELCSFASDNNATYVLFNPLSNMGRGNKSIKQLRLSNKKMERLREKTSKLRNKIEVVYIRFPNKKKKPLSSCEAGNIIYVFTNGEATVCPYLVFAARNSENKYKASDFIVGNIFSDDEIRRRLESFDFKKLLKSQQNPKCQKCQFEPICGRGCPAAVIMNGDKLSSYDRRLCPFEKEADRK